MYAVVHIAAVYAATGMPYLDVIHRLRSSSNLPIAAYQVSGEYSMIKAASKKVPKVLWSTYCMEHL